MVEVAGKYDWYQSPTWDDHSARVFEERIARARRMRPQYMEIQGRTLLRAGSPRDREAGRALLYRMISDYADAPDDYYDARHAVVTAWGMLGESHHADGEIAEAVTAFSALRTLAPTVPHLHTVGYEIHYLDVLTELGDPDSIDEAFLEVERLRVELSRDSLRFPKDIFALALRAARLYRIVGDPRATAEASTALHVLTNMDDPIRRHHLLGEIDSTVKELDELDAIIESFRPAT